MENYEQLMQIIKKQESELQFGEFTNDTALALGLQLVEKGRSGNKAITIDICRNGQQLFHYSFENTSKDNDKWVIRKNNVVNRFFTSSLYVGLKLKKDGKSIEEKYLVSSKDFAPYGGAFPLIIKNVGVVGTITVSGLTQIEDHEFVVEGIREFLNKNNN